MKEGCGGGRNAWCCVLMGRCVVFEGLHGGRWLRGRQNFFVAVVARYCVVAGWGSVVGGDSTNILAVVARYCVVGSCCRVAAGLLNYFHCL